MDRVASRPPRSGERPCDAGPSAAGHPAALLALDAQLAAATWLPELYTMALRTVRRSHPSACSVLLEVDAEQLSIRHPIRQFSSTASRRLADRVLAAPLPLDHDELAVIESGANGPEGDPLRAILERRLRLTGPAIGRLRLDGMVVALIVLGRSSHPATAADQRFLEQVAERVSTRMDSLLDVFLVDTPG